MAIIDNTRLTLDQKDKQLTELVPPTIYDRLMGEMYPKLRRNDYRIEYNVRNFDLEEARALVDSEPQKLSVSEFYKVAGSYAKDSKEYKHVMAVAAKPYPQVVAAAVNQAGLLIAEKKYDEALQVLAASDQQNGSILAAQGYVYLQKANYAKAREALAQAAAKGSADAKHNLAELDKYLKSL